MEFDEEINTIPQLIGAKNALFLSFFLIIILFSILVFLGNYKLCFFLLITCLILLPSLKSNNEFYYLIFIDGLLIIFPFFWGIPDNPLTPACRDRFIKIVSALSLE